MSKIPFGVSEKNERVSKDKDHLKLKHEVSVGVKVDTALHLLPCELQHTPSSREITKRFNPKAEREREREIFSIFQKSLRHNLEWWSASCLFREGLWIFLFLKETNLCEILLEILTQKKARTATAVAPRRRARPEVRRPKNSVKVPHFVLPKFGKKSVGF